MTGMLHYRLTRRMLAGALLVPAMVARGVGAQTPEASPFVDDVNILPDPETFPGFVASASRRFQLTEPRPEILEGGPVGFIVTGIQFDSEENAEGFTTQLSAQLPDTLMDALTAGNSVEESGIQVSQSSQSTNDASRLELSITLSLDDEMVDSVAVAVVLVQKGDQVQTWFGLGIADVIGPLGDLVDVLDDRWPASDLWALVPTLDDVPPGMSLVEETTRP
jgi:hypothetical protein